MNGSEVMKVISVINQKGGVGKTTTVGALAAILLEKEFRVCVIDLDQQRNLSIYYGLKNEADLEGTVADVFLRDDVELKELVYETSQGDIIPASGNLAVVESAIINELDRPYKLKNAIKGLDEYYDFIIIDTPPSLGIVTINALTASDYAVIPSEAGAFSMAGIVQVNNTIATVQKHTNHELIVAGVLITKFNRNTNAQQAMKEYIEQLTGAYEQYVFDATIRNTITIGETQIQGKSVVEYARHNDVTYDYRHFTSELLGRIGVEE